MMLRHAFLIADKGLALLALAAYCVWLTGAAAAGPPSDTATFQVAPGFRIELVAAEPLLRDPIAIAFDENGRMFVVEYPEYNQQFAGNGNKREGSVRMLVDTNGDGRFDKSTIYVSGLKAPSAVACYDGGVFVAVPPDLLFCKDTDGDGRADVREVVFTGFVRLPNRTDPSLNSILWAFDNRFHACTSYSGSTVRSVAHPNATPRSIRNRGFLFDPRTRTFDLTSGGGQHGLAIDDWGREFLCNNSSPVRMIMYDDRYVARNPYLKAPAPAVEITERGKYTQLYRISPEEPWRVERTRLRTEGAFRGSDEGGKSSGFFTSATGITIYRGHAWPPQYGGNVFVGEPANNLVFRAQLEPNGVGFVARRASSRASRTKAATSTDSRQSAGNKQAQHEQAEFLASTDTSFRPVQFANAPDGTLYVIDMHRELIEGAMFLPSELLKRVNVSGGVDRGRIYRIVPDDFTQPAPPRLGEATTAELVALLEHPNGWHRDTASRLLYQRQDQTAVPALRRLAATSQIPVARMTALYALDGLGALTDAALLHAMRDRVAEVRVHAIRLAEGRLASSATLRTRYLELAQDSSLIVRYQLAFSLGELPFTEERNLALATLIVRDGRSSWMRLAVLSSLAQGAADMFRRLAAREAFRRQRHGREFLVALTRQIAAAGQWDEMRAVVGSLEHWGPKDPMLGETITLALLSPQTPTVRKRLLAARGTNVQAIYDRLCRQSKAHALDEDLTPGQRVLAVRRLGLVEFKGVRETFERLLEPHQPSSVQSEAIHTLSRYGSPTVAELLLQRWPTLTPALRSRVVETLLSRAAWTTALLDAVERGEVGRGDLDAARIDLLKKHPNPSLANRAQTLFAESSLPRRRQIVATYQAALEMKGDIARGKQVFRKVCAACHRLDGVGTAIGADLQAIGDQGKAAILLNILDPNRDVKPQFLSYSILIDDGRVISGMIINESVNSITVRHADETETTVLRIHIEELRSSGMSFMPEGLEKQIDPPSMADLLAYLTSRRK